MKSNKPIIEVDGITKKFLVKGKEKIAINTINFKIKEGEIVGYIGKNGAGKSTMIKILCGILTPTYGKAEVNGIIPYQHRLKNANNIGVVFGQRTQLWWDLPVIDSFKVLKEIYKINDAIFEKRLDYFDKLFDISQIYSSLTRTLSLGERMKADIVASMLHNPKVLFLDEPTIGLDFYAKTNMRKAIVDINKKYNTTIILTTHDLKDVEEVCDRILILDNAQLIYNKPIHDLKKQQAKIKKIKFSVDSNKKENIVYKIINFLSELNSKYKINYFDDYIELMIDSFDQKRIIDYLISLKEIKNISIQNNSLENIINNIYEHEKSINTLSSPI